MNKLDFATKYDFTAVEKGKYNKWLEAGYFKAGDITKKPYTIVIPPPNITGKLHLGHVWDTTLQDIIIRRKRMMGYDALFLPGMDHASIATQARVEAKLKEEGISRYDLGREKFLEVSWEWKDKYASLIREQWAVIGLSLDYSRERFTLDEGLNHAVNTVFVKMYNEGLIYRGKKIINWDVQSQTALSNIEVDHKEIEGAMYHIRYNFVDEENGLEVATSRPETMFGDVALMVHPDDKRYHQYIGRKVYIPLTNIAIPIISDEYVDPKFGSGVVKVTPAHDPNDYEVGLRHNLEMPLCMHDNGIMNELAGPYEGMERFACREQVIKDLTLNKQLIKTKKMIHSVGHSERTGVIVEPRLSEQWFVKMEPLANEIIKMQKTSNKIYFTPARFEKVFLSWLVNIHDWCISRQLWWGHRIPAWYRGKEVYVGVEAPVGEGWIQDEDALDTWFSSALWPFSTLGWPEQTADLEKFYPTNTLVTGSDIIFFWVARMAFQAKYLTGTRPFKDVLIHGLIRDEIGRKVSKSLDNGVELMEAVNEYGIDALRYFLTTSTTAGADIRYSDEKMKASWNYINKLWNVARYIKIQLDNINYCERDINFELLRDYDKWILRRLNLTIKEVDIEYERFNFNKVARLLYHFVWDEFAAWYLEISKYVLNNASAMEKLNNASILHLVLNSILKLIHPFMPFVTDELYARFNQDAITIAKWPEENPLYNKRDFLLVASMERVFALISAVRNLRLKNNIANKDKLNIYISSDSKRILNFFKQNKDIISHFTNAAELHFATELTKMENSAYQMIDRAIVMIVIDKEENIVEIQKKLKDEQAKMLAEINRCEKMLNNVNFLAKAPASKIKEEQEKIVKYKTRLDEINSLLQK